MPAPTLADAPVEQAGAPASPSPVRYGQTLRRSSLVATLRLLRSGLLPMMERLDAMGGDVARVTNALRSTVLLRHPDLVRALLVEHDGAFTKALGLRLAKEVLGEGLLDRRAAPAHPAAPPRAPRLSPPEAAPLHRRDGRRHRRNDGPMDRRAGDGGRRRHGPPRARHRRAHALLRRDRRRGERREPRHHHRAAPVRPARAEPVHAPPAPPAHARHPPLPPRPPRPRRHRARPRRRRAAPPARRRTTCCRCSSTPTTRMERR